MLPSCATLASLLCNSRTFQLANLVTKDELKPIRSYGRIRAAEQSVLGNSNYWFVNFYFVVGLYTVNPNIWLIARCEVQNLIYAIYGSILAMSATA